MTTLEKTGQFDFLKWLNSTSSDFDQESGIEDSTGIAELLSAEDDPSGLPADLFSACLELSTDLAVFIRKHQSKWTIKQRARYAESHSRLCLWRDNTREGCLDLCFLRSPDLYRSVLDLLCALGRTFLHGDHHAPGSSYKNRMIS